MYSNNKCKNKNGFIYPGSYSGMKLYSSNFQMLFDSESYSKNFIEVALLSSTETVKHILCSAIGWQVMINRRLWLGLGLELGLGLVSFHKKNEHKQTKQIKQESN